MEEELIGTAFIVLSFIEVSLIFSLYTHSVSCCMFHSVELYGTNHENQEHNRGDYSLVFDSKVSNQAQSGPLLSVDLWNGRLKGSK